MNVGLIVAMTRDGLIGRDGDLPWRLPEDLKHFKRTTVGATIVMGRGCWDSIGRPLPKRTNVVLSRAWGADAGADGLERDGMRVFGDLPSACAWIEREQPDGEAFAWILGGGQVYEQVLAPLEGGVEALRASAGPVPARLIVTWVPSLALQDGDVLFPFDEAWIERHYDEVSSRAGETDGLTFVEYALRDAED